MAAKKNPPSNDPRVRLAAVRDRMSIVTPHSSTTKERIRLELDDIEATMFERYVEATAVGEFFTSEKELNDKPLKERLLAKWCHLAWKNSAIPDNPEVSVQDKCNNYEYARAVFVVKAQFRPGHILPKPENRNGRPARDFLLDALTMSDNGLKQEVAERIIDQEVVFESDLSVQMSALLDGKFVRNVWVPATPEEQAIGLKLLDWIESGITGKKIAGPTLEESQILLSAREEKMRVKEPKGFLMRSLRYASNLNQFQHIVSVFKPDLSWQGVTFAEGAPANQNPRLAAALRILKIEVAT